MIQFDRFLDGKKRILTFSFDDGHENDFRLIDLLNKYKLKSTFHLNGCRYVGRKKDELKKISDIYSKHEISCHTLSHGWPARMPSQSLINEIMEDRKILEQISNYPVIGMSYPSGSYNENVIDIMKMCSICYSRTVKSTMNFHLPDNFLEWNPSCHFKKANEICDSFLNNLDSQWTGPLFYIWGHSHELVTEEDWIYIESIMKKLAFNDKIWYATNIEICDYMNAQHSLKISADETIFYNPTQIDVWVSKDKIKTIHIPAGKTVYTD